MSGSGTRHDGLALPTRVGKPVYYTMLCFRTLESRRHASYPAARTTHAQ